MNVNITFTFNKEDDGIQQTVDFYRSEVDDLYALAQFLTGAVQGAGYSYVDDVGFQKRDGNEVWGEG